MAVEQVSVRFFKHYALFDRMFAHIRKLRDENLDIRDTAFSIIRIVSEAMFCVYLLTDHIIVLNIFKPLKNKAFVDFNEWLTDFTWVLMTIIDVSGLLIQMSKSKEQNNDREFNRQALKVLTNVFDFMVR